MKFIFFTITALFLGNYALAQGANVIATCGKYSVVRHIDFKYDLGSTYWTTFKLKDSSGVELDATPEPNMHGNSYTIQYGGSLNLKAESKHFDKKTGLEIGTDIFYFEAFLHRASLTIGSPHRRPTTIPCRISGFSEEWHYDD
jgi:hypothetical protein